MLRSNEALRREYETTKHQLAKLYGDRVLIYCNNKRPVIRKIFLEDGWTEAEVDEAEAQAKRDWPEYVPSDFYEGIDEGREWPLDQDLDQDLDQGPTAVQFLVSDKTNP